MTDSTMEQRLAVVPTVAINSATVSVDSEGAVRLLLEEVFSGGTRASRGSYIMSREVAGQLAKLISTMLTQSNN